MNPHSVFVKCASAHEKSHKPPCGGSVAVLRDEMNPHSVFVKCATHLKFA